MKREEQLSLANAQFERFAKPTKRAAFLSEMDAIVPWERLCALIAPHYPTGEGGRPPIPLERMLRIYFLQQWFNLSDPGAEEALYDIASMRSFAQIDLGSAPVPDETTVCKFRHLLERHKLGPTICVKSTLTWQSPASKSATERSSMRRFFTHRVRPRIVLERATLKCIRR